MMKESKRTSRVMALCVSVLVFGTLAAPAARADMPYFGALPINGNYWNSPDHNYRPDGAPSDAYGAGGRAYAKGSCRNVKVPRRLANGAVVMRARKVCG